MKKGYLPKQISKNWFKHMIEFIPLKYGEIVANEEAIRESKEIKSFDYDEYINLVQYKNSFTQICDVFKINKKLYSLLKSEGIDNQEVRKRLANYLFLQAKNRRFLIWLQNVNYFFFNTFLFSLFLYETKAFKLN
jgi:hypothetical protein